MKVKVWVPFEVSITKAEIKKSMKRVRERWTLEATDPVHMEDVIHDLINNGIVELPRDENGLFLKFDPEWETSFMEADL